MKNLGNKAAKGFTLIELLVVIAIIGILAGLLLPVLKKAQDSANKTTGISNIKQFGLALRIYEDREGQFPPYDGDRFLACLFNTGEVPDIKLFTPKGASQPALTAGQITLAAGCIPGLCGYKNSTNPMTDWINPSVCAIAADCIGAATAACPYGGGTVRVVLYQDGSAKPQGGTITIGAANGGTTTSKTDVELTLIVKE